MESTLDTPIDFSFSPRLSLVQNHVLSSGDSSVGRVSVNDQNVVDSRLIPKRAIHRCALGTEVLSGPSSLFVVVAQPDDTLTIRTKKGRSAFL